MKTELELRASIRELQAVLLGAPPALRIEIEPEHQFMDGLYLRKIKMPPGSIVVGKTHKKDHVLVIGKGRVRMVNEKGDQDIKGPKMFLCHGGTKRVFQAGQLGAEIVTIHPNPLNLRDIAELDALYTENI